MGDIQPPTQPKAFAVSTGTPPTQPKNFIRPLPTGPRLAPTTPEPPQPPPQPPMLGTPSDPVPAQPDSGPTIAGASVEEEPKIGLPKIEEFVVPIADTKADRYKKLNKTVNHM